MTITGLNFSNILDSLNKNRHIVIDSFAGGILSFLIKEIYDNLHHNILLIVEDDFINFFYSDLNELLGNNIFIYPSSTSSIYSNSLIDNELIFDRINILYNLLNKKEKHVILISPLALLEKTIPKNILESSLIHIQKGEEIFFDLLKENLLELGYINANGTVRMKGEFASRGGIIDVFPPNNEYPLRIEFWADEVDSIRIFDPITQKSIKEIEQSTIPPASEIIFSDFIIKYVKNKLNNFISESQLKDEFIKLINEKSLFPGYKKFLHLFYNELHSVIDFLKKDDIIVEYNPLFIEKKWIEKIATLNKEYEEKRILEAFIGKPEELCLFYKEFLNKKQKFQSVEIHYSNLYKSHRGIINYKSHLNDAFRGNLNLFRNYVNKYYAQGYKIYILCENKGQKKRIEDIFEDLLDKITLEIGYLSTGFRDVTSKIIVITDHEIFSPLGYRRKVVKKIKPPSPLTQESLVEGDYVVHENYGIGIYKGIKRIKIENSEYDCLVINYLGDDKIYVPVEQIYRIEKYRSKDDIPPILNKLGTKSWEKLKEKTKKAIEDMAKELLEIYAIRKSEPGFAFFPDDIMQEEMEASFPYQETPDQLRAIEEIKKDMESAHPMDRLLCGDVGFGKTEVAIRAAFKATRSNKQVIVLVPTTILAEQHFNTFSQRLKNFGTKIAVINRFVKPATQKKLIEDFKKGDIDILIGTHRLLSNDIKPKDLGLLIIDEEHKFGVKHKEKIKKMKKTIDVLSMTATPIPRTLHLSLMGSRDISIIQTPPENRLSIQTEIIFFDEETIKNAIIKEINRGGQVFFVHNRIKTINETVSKLKKLLPNIKFGVIHGQMEGILIEDTMLQFIKKEIDVLVSTMIIESGIDLPSVNTIIIDLADKMGLAQLYQLRGRVGRSNLQAYAYFIIPELDKLSDSAIKRIQALREFSHLGSGMSLAMRDMEIRGVGNILGPQQHGFVQAIGFDMYIKLLEETIHKIKGNCFETIKLPELNIRIDTFIDDSYINDKNIKLEFYQKIVKSKNIEQLDALYKELEDRFGKVPTPTANLILKHKLAIHAAPFKFDKIIINKKQKILCLYELENLPDKEIILGIIKNSTLPVSIKSEEKFILEFLFKKSKGIVHTIIKAIENFKTIREKINGKSNNISSDQLEKENTTAT